MLKMKGIKTPDIYLYKKVINE